MRIPMFEPVKWQLTLLPCLVDPVSLLVLRTIFFQIERSWSLFELGWLLSGSVHSVYIRGNVSPVSR